MMSLLLVLVVVFTVCGCGQAGSSCPTKNVDYIGQSVKTIDKVCTWDACAMQCKASKLCNFWSLHKFFDRCNLMHEVTGNKTDEWTKYNVIGTKDCQGQPSTIISPDSSNKDCVKMVIDRTSSHDPLSVRVTKRNIANWEKCRDLCATSCCIAWSYYTYEYYQKWWRNACSFYKTPTLEEYDKKKTKNVISGTKHAIYCPTTAGPTTAQPPTTTVATDLYSVVYVDAVKGNAQADCGRIRESACKHIQEALAQREHGVVHVIGDQVLNETLLITRYVSITSTKEDMGRIVGDGSAIYAFRVMKELISFNISHLHFLNISLLKMHVSALISIYNIHFTSMSPGMLMVLNIRQDDAEDVIIFASEATFPGVSARILISHSHFTDMGILYFRLSGSMFKSSLTIRDSVFKNFTLAGSLHIYPFDVGIFVEGGKGSLHIHNCSFSLNRRAGVLLFMSMTNIVNITSSRFFDTYGVKEKNTLTSFLGVMLYMQDVSEAFVSHCSFHNATAFKSGSCVYMVKVKSGAIDCCTFTSSHSGAFGGVAEIHDCDDCNITACSFIGNRAEEGGGALRVGTKIVGGSTGRTTIQHCVFENNQVLKDGHGQAIYSNTKLHLRNITVSSIEQSSVAHLQLHGDFVSLKDVHVISKNVGMFQSSFIKRMIEITSKDIKADEKITISCPDQFDVRSSYISYEAGDKGKGYISTSYKVFTSFQASCVSCPSNEYTLQAGKFDFRITTIGSKSHWFPYMKHTECAACPPGARCKGKIIPLDNHWGYQPTLTSTLPSNQLHFIQCPSGYCCSALTTLCADFNTCVNGRTGKLCGSCQDGYALSFVSGKCVRKIGVECNFRIFIVYFVAVSMVYTIALTFIPSIEVIEVIKDLIASRNSNTGEIDANEAHQEGNKLSIREDQDGDKLPIRTRETAEEKETLPMSAYVITVVLFFQLASLIHVKLPEEKEPSSRNGAPGNAFQQTLFDVFNFRVTISQTLCPMDDLTLPIKESINVGMKVCSIFNLVLFFIFGKCMQILSQLFSTHGDADEVSETEELNSITIKEDQSVTKLAKVVQRKLSFTSILKIGFIKLVKLNLTSISTFAFHMVHCVQIADTIHLYLYADHMCFADWQYVILFVVLPVVLFFPASFGVSLNLLKEGSISASTFLLASAVPYYALGLYVKRKISGLPKHTPCNDEKKCIDTILEMEEELFKSKDALLRWPVVQLYRNFVIVILTTFVLNPIYRTIIFVPVFLAFSAHDHHRMPYKHPYLNYVQWLSSCCLCVISVCNIPASMALMTNIMAVPSMAQVMLVLHYTQLILITIVPLSLVGWKLWKKYLVLRMPSKKVV